MNTSLPCAESALLALENGDDVEAERLTDAADIRGEEPSSPTFVATSRPAVGA